MENNTENKNDNSNKAIAALVLGCIGVVTWYLPFIGLPVTIVGLVLGIKAKNSSRKKMAKIAVVLCIVFLVVTSIFSVLGLYLVATGIMNKTNTVPQTETTQTAKLNKTTPTPPVDNPQISTIPEIPSNLPAKITFYTSLTSSQVPVGKNTTFPVGKLVVHVSAPKGLKTSKMQITIYLQRDMLEGIYGQKDQTLTGEWTSVNLPIKISDKGKYRIEFRTTTKKSNDTILASNTVTIK